VCEDIRPCLVDRAYDILLAINEWRTDDLDVAVCARRVLDYEGADILVDVPSKHCLDHEDVGESVDCLHNAEIIYITVAVEVEVRDHVRRIVEKDLEIPYIG